MIDVTSVSLLRRLRESEDDDAWELFDAEYRGFMLRFLKSQKVDSHVAEDICQNSMKHVYEVMTGRGFIHNGNPGAFRNWLRKVVSSHLAEFRRKSKRSTVDLPEGLDEDLGRDDSRLAHLWDREHNRAILETVLNLLKGQTPEDSLSIFRRTFVEGVSAEQAAEEFGRTKNAIVVAKCKVLKKARELAGQMVE